MAIRINKEKLKNFLLRRRVNTYGLLVITIACIVITLLCALSGMTAKKLDLLLMVDIALVILCFLQAYKMRSTFRTIPSFKGSRKKKKDKQDETNS